MSKRINDKLSNDALIDEQSLGDYLKRESEFSQRYRAIKANEVADEVPAELDRAILLHASQTASTNKVVKLNELRKWRRLTLPFAMAATLVLGVSIVMRSGNQLPTRVPTEANQVDVEVDLLTPTPQANLPPPKLELPSVAESAPAHADKPLMRASHAEEPMRLKETAASLTVTASKEKKQRTQAISEKEEAAIAAKSAVAGAIASASVASPVQQNMGLSDISKSSGTTVDATTPVSQTAQPTEANKTTAQRSRDDRGSVEEVVVTGARIQQKQTFIGPRSTPASAPSSQVSANAYEKEQREANPIEWLEYIRELRQAKKNFTANREWTRFVKAYPNYEVAADDIARGEK
jgi:hypothetical protein